MVADQTRGAEVREVEVEEIWVFCSAAEFRKHKWGLIRLAEWVSERADQQAVAVFVSSPRSWAVVLARGGRRFKPSSI